MPRPALGKVAVGDELIVIERLHRSSREYTATVTKVGRVWIDLRNTHDVRSLAKTWRMRLDTQTNGSASHYADRFVTAEQHAWEQQISVARRAVFDAGIEMRGGSAWNHEDRLPALAAFVAAYDADHPTDPTA